MSNEPNAEEPSDAEREALKQLSGAIREGDLDAVRALVTEHPRTVDQLEIRGPAPLAEAISRGNDEIARWLVEHGACANPETRFLHCNPLARAIATGNVEMARRLVAKGASLETVAEMDGSLRGIWYEALRLADNITTAEFYLELLTELYDPEEGLLDGLYVGAQLSDSHVRDAILAAADKLEIDLTPKLKEPLRIALKHGNIPGAETLIARGGSLRERGAPKAPGLTDAESKLGERTLGQRILDKAIRAREGGPKRLSRYEARELWESALKRGGRELGQLILDAGFDIREMERKHGSLIASLLREIETKKALPVLELMIENGLDPNLACTGHGTALYQALDDGKPEVYRFLLANGGDLTHANNRKLPFFTTQGVFQLKISEQRQLLDAGHKLLDESEDGEGRGALHAAVYYRANRKAFENMLALGAKIDQPQSWAGLTPLHLAIGEKHKDQAKWLLELGADPMATTKNGKRAIDLARAKTGFKTLVKQMEKTLDDAGIDVGACEVTLDFVEPWAAAFRDALKDLKQEQQRAAQALIALCVETNASRPGKTFLKKTAALLEAAGEDAMRDALIASLPLYKLPREGENKREGVEDERYEYADASWSTTEMNTRAMRGLLWASSALANSDIAGAAREVATAAFKKVYGIGMRNAKIGNGALNALSEMGDIGVGQIAVLSEQIKYNPAKVNVDRVLDRVAKERGVEPSQLAEMATPDYGLDGDARYVETFGEFSAELTLLGPGRTALVWRKGKADKLQSTVPAAVKRDHAAELKALKARAKEMQKVSTAVRSRLEKQYLDPRGWDLSTWRERYLDHPLAGVISRRLVWRFELGKSAKATSKSALYKEGAFVDAAGKKVAIDEATRVDLWHPLHEEDVEVVLAWRERLAKEEVVQPFKQAYREVYVVTAAEKKTRSHSLRYVGQVMDQSQVHALAGQRGWSQIRSGSWDGEMPEVQREIPSAGLAVCYDTESLHDCGTSAHGIYLYLRGGEVAFRKLLKDGGWGAKVNLAKVPPLVFSEVMRDIDLFVGVANAGNDPQWEHRGMLENWSALTTGELRASGETRRAALEAMIPGLSIADRLSLVDRWLVVRGDLMTYKIHLGSANVIMEDGHYLCIVRSREKAKGVNLPFEGDSKLSEILSKAFLLAADKKIKDETILSQINVKR